jgi:O-antigen biosynthesis protein
MSMTPATPLVADGKFFRVGARKFFPQGVTYGPFAPNEAGEPFASVKQTRADFAQVVELGANVLRLYHLPPPWVLDMAANYGLRLLVDVPWNKEVCFLDSEQTKRAVRQTVRRVAEACGRHPAVFGVSVVNEIRSDIVRWCGARQVAEFIDSLVAEVKEVAPQCLCTFGNYPPTEFLRPREIDFHCFNVYLHQPAPFEHYLARLQMLADGKPLLLGEFGIDSQRQGQERQQEMLRWQIESAFRNGVAGVIVYSFTDDWFKDNRPVTDWAFGLTTKDRAPKPAWHTVKSCFATGPYPKDPQLPRVSVVVASYNASRTLQACLNSVTRLRYPDYEVILVDDGSTDDTTALASKFPDVRYVRHPHNLGLSEARNTGIAAARGEIVAFTDADCRADEDWLYYLVTDLIRGGYAGIGGPNLLPPEDSCVASVVMASPGGPAHVMLTDRLAEHIPGCNMAFYKWVFLEAGGFDPQFRCAGDDVDMCWRLQHAGYRVGFSHAGFVWHYRRSRIQDYLRQQYGYGEAEALLVRKHPEYFSSLGGGIWRGRIYTSSQDGLVFRPARIYYGPFASGFFQSLYTTPPVSGFMFFTSLEYHVLVTLPLLAASIVLHRLWPLGLLSGACSLGVCILAGAQASIPSKKLKFWSRPLAGLLFLLQPIVRGWARYQGRIGKGLSPLDNKEDLDSLSLTSNQAGLRHRRYWVQDGRHRLEFLTVLINRLKDAGWRFKVDMGWSEYDLEIVGDHWSRLQILTAAEMFQDNKLFIRCRLRPRWSLSARLSLAITLAMELFLGGLLQGWTTPQRLTLWIIVMAASCIGLVYWFHQHNLRLQRITAVFLDKTAASLSMSKIDEEALESQDKPA